MSNFDDMDEMVRGLDRLTHPFREIDEATRQICEVDLIAQSFAKASHIFQHLGDVGQIARAIEESSALSVTLSKMPELCGATTIDELTRQIREVDLARQSFAESRHIFQQLGGRGQIARVIEESSALSVAVSEMSDLPVPAAMDLWWQYREVAEQLLAYQSVFHQVGSGLTMVDFLQQTALQIESAAQDLNQFLDPLPCDQLSTYLHEITANTLWLTEQPFIDSSAGIFSSLSSDSEQGLFAWRASYDRALVHAGAWSTKPSESKGSTIAHSQVEVACEISCAICGNHVPVSGATLYVSATGEIRARVTIIPLCTECMRKDRGSPGWFVAVCYDLLREEIYKSRPQFQLFRGDGKGTAPPRGRDILSLVKTEARAELTTGSKPSAPE